MVKAWTNTPLGKVADIKTGPFDSTLHASDYVNLGTPIITVEHLGEYSINHINLPMVSDSDKKRLSAYILQKGDIVFSRVGSVDRNAYVTSQEDGWLFSGRLLRIRTLESCILNSRYPGYYFSFEPTRTRIRSVAVGQTMAPLNTKLLKSFIVGFPLLCEQRRIAEALSNTDAMLSSLEKLIAKKKAIKQGAMQELLTGRKRLAGFRGNWIEKPLEQIIRIRQERINPHEHEKTKCVELEHVEPRTGRLLSPVDSWNQASLKAMFQNGDILFGKLRPYLRKFYYASFNGLCSTEFWVFTAFDDAINNQYIYHLVQTDQFLEIANSTTGTKMPRADWSLMKDATFCLPVDISEQNAIASLLQDMSSEVYALEQDLIKHHQIKQGMMQQLLTGRTRLV